MAATRPHLGNCFGNGRDPKADICEMGHVGSIAPKRRHWCSDKDRAFGRAQWALSNRCTKRIKDVIRVLCSAHWIRSERFVTLPNLT